MKPKISIIASEFNKTITTNLVKGAQKVLELRSLKEAKVYWVPGAYELPLACQWLSDKYDALIAVGTVIKGETSHFDLICRAVSEGIADVSRKNNIPIGFGVITANNTEQAVARSADDNNLGYRAAMAAIKMLDIKKEIGKS